MTSPNVVQDSAQLHHNAVRGFQVGDRVLWNQALDAVYEVLKISGGHATINLLESHPQKGKLRPNAKRLIFQP